MGKLVVVLRSEVLKGLPVLFSENLMLQMQPCGLKLSLNLRQGWLFALLRLIIQHVKQRQLHHEPSDVRFLSERGSIMVLRHLNDQELLTRDSSDPELTIKMTVLDLEVVSW